LREKGLNGRQIKAVLYVVENKKITNGEYQKLNNISRRTETDELTELTSRFEIFKNTGYGAGSYYELRVNNCALMGIKKTIFHTISGRTK